MTVLLKALVFGVLTSVGAWVAHRGFSAFHDGVRPFVRDVEAGRMDRDSAARSTWDMSVGFVAFYGAPFSLATGVMEKHILFLTADWIGVRVRSSAVALAGGFAWGAIASLAVSATHWAFAHLPQPIDRELLLIVVPVFYMLPLIPVVAAGSQFGARPALGLAFVSALVFFLAWYLIDQIYAVPAAFLVSVAVHLYWAARDKVEPLAQPEEFERGARDVRRGIVPLLLIGALAGLAASFLWLAGEPITTMLVGADRPIEAAMVAIFSWFGFVSLVSLTGLASGAYVSMGMPDSVTGFAFLAHRAPFLGAPIGAAVMAGEIFALGRLERLLSRRPGLHGAGAPIRDGLTLVADIGMLVGGAISANTIWPGFGLFVVGALWFLNEAFGVRVMRLAVGPIGAILTGLLLNALLALGVAVPSFDVPLPG